MIQSRQQYSGQSHLQFPMSFSSKSSTLTPHSVTMSTLCSSPSYRHIPREWEANEAKSNIFYFCLLQSRPLRLAKDLTPHSTLTLQCLTPHSTLQVHFIRPLSPDRSSSTSKIFPQGDLQGRSFIHQEVLAIMFYFIWHLSNCRTFPPFFRLHLE